MHADASADLTISYDQHVNIDLTCVNLVCFPFSFDAWGDFDLRPTQTYNNFGPVPVKVGQMRYLCIEIDSGFARVDQN